MRMLSTREIEATKEAMTMNRNAPCHNCDARFPGCHDVCMRYEAWKITRGKETEAEKRDKEAWLVARNGRRRTNRARNARWEVSMAEFFEVMKQAQRMCGSNSCDNCMQPRITDGLCIWKGDLSEFTDEVIAEIEAKTMDWNAKHPEPQYPTWKEWNEQEFPDAVSCVEPCRFMSIEKWSNLSGLKCYCCNDCREKPIPADIAKKLGIKPKEA